ncbi:phosphoribosylanthranilate isomerase [Methanopyrus kandleri]
MVRVKICGITRPEDAATADEAGTDAVGCVVEVPVSTPRKVSVEHANEVFSVVSPFVSRVAVLMDNLEPIDRLEEATAVQLHGTEDPETCEELSELGFDVIKTFWVDQRGSVWLGEELIGDEVLAEYCEIVDAVLLDTKSAGGGGSGERHDWDASARLVRRLDVPVILAGGLNPENVREAVETVRPYAVDTSSGVEKEPGIKDPEAIAEFVRATKSV